MSNLGTKSVEQVFIETLINKLEDRENAHKQYLTDGRWETFSEGKDIVAVLQTLKAIKQDFEDVYNECFGE